MATTTWPDDPVPLLARVLAPLGEVIGAQRLTGGMFATTFRVDLADGRHVVAKTAPTDTDRLMSYELDLLRTEASVYRAAADALPVPHVLLEDQSRAVIPSDVLIVTHLPGVPLSEAGFGPADDDPRTACPQRDLGAAMARLHRLSGPRFGYPNAAAGLQADTWAEAFGAIVGSLLADSARWGAPLDADEIRDTLARHAGALASVARPALVHHDLWPANVFVDPSTGGVVGIIDTERALWGDPLLDLVGAEPFGQAPPAPSILAGYADEGSPLDVSSDTARRRLLLGRLDMAVVMTVEQGFRRYTGDWVDEHRAAVARDLRAALDALD